MAKIYNFWTTDEALDHYFYAVRDINPATFEEYLTGYAPHLLKKKDRLWNEINLGNEGA